MLAASKSGTETALDVSEIFLIVSGLILTWGAIGEYLEEHDKLPRWMKWPKLVFILMVVVGLLGEFFSDAGVYVFSRHLQTLEGADIKALEITSAKALSDSTAAIDEAKTALGVADAAKTESGKAKEAASTAESVAHTARKEADSFEKDIASSKEQLLMMSARYKLIRKGEAEFIKAIEAFPGQQVELQLCRALVDTDNETGALYQSLVDLLSKAKWEIHVAVWQSCINGMGVSVWANNGSRASTMAAANALGRILDKLLRVDRKPGEFEAWEKIRDAARFAPWGWMMRISDRDQPLAAETVRVSIFGRFP